MNKQVSTYLKAQPLHTSVYLAHWSSQKVETAHFMSNSVLWRPSSLLPAPVFHLPSRASIHKSLYNWFKSCTRHLFLNSTYPLVLQSCPAMKQLIKCIPGPSIPQMSAVGGCLKETGHMRGLWNGQCDKQLGAARDFLPKFSPVNPTMTQWNKH